MALEFESDVGDTFRRWLFMESVRRAESCASD